MRTVTTSTLLALLTACSDGRGGGKSDTDADTDVAVDTDASDDTDANASASWNAVITSLEVASARDALDLDDDGQGDNALAAARVVLNPLLADAIATAGRVVILQVAHVDAATDSSVAIAALTAADADATASNNAGASFDAGVAVDALGVALVSTDASLDAGAYAVTVASEAITVGDFTFQAATGLHLEGTASAASNTGRLGIAIRVAPLVAALEAADKADTAATLSALADVDTDTDGTADAISATFTFRAQACSLE
jgi:hypothetical protein